MIIKEASLSRIWKHVENKQQFALFTGFRDKYTYEENVNRNKSIAAKLRNAGYGYFFVDGNWIENEGTDDEVPVQEDSIFAIGNGEEFKNLIISLGKQYEQDAVLISNQEGNFLYDKNGNKIQNVGSIRLGRLGPIYSSLRPSQKNRYFVFETEREASGWISRLAELAGVGNPKKED